MFWPDTENEHSESTARLPNDSRSHACVTSRTFTYTSRTFRPPARVGTVVTVNAARFIRSATSLRLAQALAARAFPPQWRTRFAPAPTGYLHLGHVVNALHVWGVARAHGGQVLLRIEDHDRSRCRPEFERALLDDLDWLGFTPDIGTTDEFRAGDTLRRQSDNRQRYTAALHSLAVRKLEYGCICTRTDIAAIAGDRSGEEIRYPGTCAHACHAAAIARRLRVSPETESFHDIRLGPQSQTPQLQCGDFLVRDRNDNFTYQLCVTVDDWDQHIDVIIRGEDLLSSAGRQAQLARVLGRSTSPQFLHHGLVLRSDGRKLSKSLGDTGVREMREAGLSREQVLGRATFACGLIDRDVSLNLDEITSLFA